MSIKCPYCDEPLVVYKEESGEFVTEACFCSEVFEMEDESSLFEYARFDPKQGDIVHDDLTGEPARVKEIFGGDEVPSRYLLDSPYLQGYRYAWEISPLATLEDATLENKEEHI